MRIHSLIIDNVRAVEHLELTDIPDTGVILIHGDNETGKSTILDALDAVLNIKHTSTKIRKLNPVGRDELPEVRLNATVGPYTFEIYKRFAKGTKGKAELKIFSPRPENLTGEQAHNRLNEILANHVDQQLMDTLFLRQGSLPDAIEAAGIPTFTRALGTSQGTDGQSAQEAEDSGLMRRVEEEYLRYFTKSGKPTKDLKESETAVEAAEQKVTAAEQSMRAYETAVDAYAQHGVDMAAIEAELPEAEQALSRRTAEAEAARELAATLAAAQEKADRAEKDLTRANDDVESRQAVIAGVEHAEAALNTLKEQHEPTREKAAAERKALAEAEKAHEQARAHAVATRENLGSAEQALAAANARARVEELDGVVTRLDAVEKEIARLVKAQPERRVTDADVRALEDATSTLTVQRRIVESTAARLDIAGPAGAAFTVNGEEVSCGGTDSIALFDGTEIRISDITLTFRAATGTETATTDLDNAVADVNRLLATIGCEDLDGARRLRDEHRELAAALEAARSRRADILGGAEADELREELTRLRETVATHDGDIPPVEEAQEALDAARRADAEARDTVADLDAKMTPLRTKPHTLTLTELETRIEVQHGNVEAARAQLAAAREKLSDEQLATNRDTATAAQTAAAAEANELKKQVELVDPEHAEERLQGERNRLDNLNRRHRHAHESRLQLLSTVNSADGEAENLDRARAELETATVRRDALHRKANAAKLLRDTMVFHRDSARAKYAAPFAQALQRHASRVFGPGTEFTLDDQLRVQARTVDGTTVDLSELSGGAKEQMALLTRFAIADLVAAGEQGTTPVPVVIDDALGATDPKRLESMNAVFTKAGETAQVFVLTSFPHRFDRVSAAKTASIQELKRFAKGNS